MAKKKCNPLNIQEIVNTEILKNPDGSNRTPEEVAAAVVKVNKDLEKKGITGFIDAYKTLIISKADKMSDDEVTLFESEIEFIASEVQKGKSFFDIMDNERKDRFLRLLTKFKLTSNKARVSVERLKYVMDLITATPADRTITAMELLENSLEAAKQRKDTKQIEKLEAALKNMRKAQLVSSQLKIDWNAIQDNSKKREKLLMEIALLEALLEVGDKETAKNQAKIEQKILALSIQAKNKRKLFMEEDAELTEEEEMQANEDFQKEMRELASEVRKLQAELSQVESERQKEIRQSTSKRITDLKIKIDKLDDSNADLYFAQAVVSTFGVKPDFFASSLRDIKQRAIRVRDRIQFVKQTIKNAKDDDKFTLPEAIRLFGKDITTLPVIQAMFKETATNPDGSEVKTDSTKPNTQLKEFITKEDMNKIFDIWSEMERENIFDNSFDLEEAKQVQDIIVAGDRKLISGVNPEDPQPTTRSFTEASQAVTGKQYNLTTAQDKNAFIVDLRNVLGRLNTLSLSPRFNGVIPEWALIAALGTDAQSLFTLFDSTITNPQELDMDQLEFSHDPDKKLEILRQSLKAYGYSDEEIQKLPEFQNPNFMFDFNHLITFKVGIDPKTNKVNGISIVTMSNEERVVHSFKPSSGQFLNSEEINSAINILAEFQNKGFKVVGHNILGRNGDINALAVNSGDLQKLLTISLRVFDTALLAFRGAPTSNFSRNRPASLNNLARAYYTSGFKGVVEDLSTLDSTSVEYSENLTASALTSGIVLQQMVSKANTEMRVLSGPADNQREQTVKIQQVVPLWFDTGNPGVGFHAGYKGIHHLYDIQPFQNIRNNLGYNLGSELMYDLTEVQNLVINLLILAINETNPSEIHRILEGLIQTPDQISKHYDFVLRLSQLDHDGYMVVKREQRAKFGNKFITDWSRDVRTKELSPILTNSVQAYLNRVHDSFVATFDAYKRSSSMASYIQKFAVIVGFREIDGTNNESLENYIGELFKFVNKLFNNKEYTFEDYGNGVFDYIPASQLGRGFAQIVLGFVREGNTLTQSIDSTMEEVDRVKEEKDAAGDVLDVESLEGEITKREYLPLKPTNVSFFSPLSRFEQERLHSDWALRKRYKAILNAKIGDPEREAWKKFIAENRYAELQNKVINAKKELRQTEKDIRKETNEEKLAELQKTKAKQKKVFDEAKQEFDNYTALLDEMRLDQGRVQRYGLFSRVNNKDIYTRIPTMEEEIEMSLEAALQLPQYIATLVHDSKNTPRDTELVLEQPSYILDPALSAGGPSGRTLFTGISSLVAHYLVNPQFYLDQNSKKINASRELVEASLRDAREAVRKGMGFSKATYWDDTNSGIHHLLVMQRAYFPDSVSLLTKLLEIRNGGELGVSKNQLTDYYTKTDTVFREKLTTLREIVADPSSKWESSNRQKDLEEIDGIEEILNSSTTTRDFFKGVVIPVIYSGGKEGVIKQLRSKRSAKVGDPLNNLTNRQIEIIAQTLTQSSIIVQGRLIDDILGMDANLVSKLTGALMSDTEQLVDKYAIDIQNILDNDTLLRNDIISIEVMRKAIMARIEYVARLSIPPLEPRTIPNYNKMSDEKKRMAVRDETERLVQEKKKQILAKWSGRIKQAEKIIDEAHKTSNNVSTGRGFVKGSDLEREVMVALAGGEQQYKQQATLLFLTKIQGAGYRLNSSEEHFLEAMVKLGRYISPDDVMFDNFIVFMTTGLGTGNSRMTYPGNYLTNLQSSDLSKGFRLEYDKNGKLDWDSSIVNSLWEITKDHPYHGLSPEDARKKAEDLAIQDYAIRLATQYPPDFLGYDWKKEESRENFFRDWQTRSEIERSFDLRQLARGGPKRQQFKELYLKQQDRFRDDKDRKEMTDDEIDSYIQSNSVPFMKREGIRLLAMPNSAQDTIITNKDAKGLGGFIPRIADQDILDAAVHGLYSIHIKSKQMREKAGAIRLGLDKAKAKGKTLQQIFEERKPGSSVYNPDQLPFIPISNNSLATIFTDTDLPITVKINKTKFILDQFAIEAGLEDLVKTKQYARLYQIYKIHRKSLRYARMLRYHAKTGVSLRELQMDHRNFVVDIHTLTKYQRDMAKKETNILDLVKEISIDPDLFKDSLGKNMRWYDAIVKLGRLGITSANALKYGLSPTEYMVISGKGEDIDVFKKSYTMTKPLFVQGRDIAQLILEVLADDRIKRAATDYAKQLGLDFKTDQQGFIILSSIPREWDNHITEAIFSDPELILSAVDNLNLYITVDILTGEVSNWTLSRAASKPSTDPENPNNNYVGLRPGLGTPTTNPVKVGPKEVTVLLTAEGLKKMLVGSRNQPMLEKLETALQTGKFLGTGTRVQALQRQRFGEYNERFLQEIAEETEILEHLHGLDPKNGLKLLVKDGQSELRDELGLTLNPYDAFYYAIDDGRTHVDNMQPSYNGLTPYGTAITSTIRVAIQRGKRYPILKPVVTELEEFYQSGQKFTRVTSFLIFLRQNVTNLTPEQERLLTAEAAGVESLTDEEWDQIDNMANKMLVNMDTINHARIKGRNPYLAPALKLLDGNPESAALGNVHGLIPRIKRQGSPVNVSASTILGRHNTWEPATQSSGDQVILIDQAVEEARELLRSFDSGVVRYEHLADQDLIESAYNPQAFEINFPGGQSAKINFQLQQLINEGVISQEVAVFYRLMIVKVMKHNPQLLQYFSLETEAEDSIQAGTAIKSRDRFKIRLNSTTLKLMGTADQVRVFAHEMAHVARLAFIQDNSPEWRKIEALVKSSRGRQSIEVMMLAMNNGKKYLGFDKDLDYYSNNPEEFIASWGSWILIQKTFASHELLKFVQSRSRGALDVHNTWQKAFHNVQRDLANIAVGMHEVDLPVLNQIMDITITMFGLAAPVDRQVEINNADQSLFNIIDLVDANNQPLGIEQSELERLESLYETQQTRPLNASEAEEFAGLSVKYQAIAVKDFSVAKYNDLRGKREARQTDPTTEEPGRAYIPFEDLSIDEKKEIAQTLVTEALQRTSKLSRSNLTFGGLTRTVANRIFGEQNVTRLIDSRARSFALTAGLTKSRFTYESSDPTVAALMHIIGDTFSITQHQYQISSGSKGIRENRNYTRQWVEAVTYRTEQLLTAASTNKEFEDLQQWAYLDAMDITRKIEDITSNKEAIQKAQELSESLRANSGNLRQFIFGNSDQYMDMLPVQLNIKMIGSSEVRSSKASKEKQALAREQLVKAVAQRIRHNILKLERVDPTAFYLTGIIPRINKNQTAASDFISELNRVREQYPDAFEFLRLATIEKLVQNGIERGKAGDFVNRAILRIDFKLETTVAEGTQSQTLIREAFLAAVKDVYHFAGTTNSLPHIAAKFNLRGNKLLQNSFKNLFNSSRNVDGSGLFSKDGNPLLPYRVISRQPISAFNYQKDSLIRQGKPEEVLASLVLGHLGEDVHYLSSRGLISGKDMASDENIAPFLSYATNVHLYEVERRQGFRAASERAIFEATGIAGYDIEELLNILGQIVNELKTENSIALTSSINIIREKLKIEQGLSHIGSDTAVGVMIQLMAKYGPDITRLAYGSNLNTASLLMEGALGTYISTVYGGNPLQFVSTVFGTFFGSYFGRNMTLIEQRGAAVNLMLGMERAMQDSREVMHITDTVFDRNASKMQKLRDWFRQNNNRGYQSVITGLTEQAQVIIIEGLRDGKTGKRDGSLYKVREIIRSGNITNLTELNDAMKKAGLIGWFAGRHLQPHLMQELNKAGLFADGVLETYEWMLANVRSKETPNTLDLQAALRFIETANWTDLGELLSKGIEFDKHQAYQTTKAIYNSIKAFREIATVDPNPWDSGTNNSAWTLLFNFYRQYPNLFMSQMILRRGSQMRTRHYVPLLVAVSILDLIYNALLMVALGVLPLTALLPGHEDFLWKKDPMKMVKTLLARNPIFGVTANFTSEMIFSITDSYNRSKLSRNTSQVKRAELAARAGLDALNPDFVPYSALKTLFAGPAAATYSLADAWLLSDKVGGNLNQQEIWEVKNSFVDSFGRMIPFLSELPFRIAQQEFVGTKPTPLPIRNVGTDPWGSVRPPSTTPKAPPSQPRPPMTPPSTQQLKEANTPSLKQQATTPIKAPM